MHPFQSVVILKMQLAQQNFIQESKKEMRVAVLTVTLTKIRRAIGRGDHLPRGRLLLTKSGVKAEGRDACAPWLRRRTPLKDTKHRIAGRADSADNSLRAN